jgi:hypothetical protein
MFSFENLLRSVYEKILLLKSAVFREDYHLTIVKVQSGNRIIRIRLAWFFFYADGFFVFVEVHDAISLSVVNMIGEDRRTGFLLGR